MGQDLTFKNILVGLDFSKYSKTALKQAAVLAEKYGARLHAVHVAEDTIPLAFPPPMVNPFAYEPPPEHVIQENVREFYGKAVADTVIHGRSGDATDGIISVALTLEAPLIVIGAAGRSALSRFLLGSHAERLTLEAPCPVWIQRGSRPRPFRNILLPVDFSETSQKALDRFRTKPLPGMRISCLYVQPEPVPLLDYRTFMQGAKHLRREIGLHAAAFRRRNRGMKLKVVTGDPVAEICGRSENYDVVVMAPHNKEGIFGRLGRVTAKVLRLSRGPVLILKP